MLTRSILLVITAALAIAGCTKSSDPGGGNVVQREGEPDYFRGGFDQAVMDRAYAKARETHQEFVAALQDPKQTMEVFAIKKPFGKEHIWLNEVTWDGSKFSAVVNNEPVDTSEVKLGDRVEVSPDEISDWMYVEGGALKGGYTIRVLFDSTSPQEKVELLKQFGFSVPPIDF